MNTPFAVLMQSRIIACCPNKGARQHPKQCKLASAAEQSSQPETIGKLGGLLRNISVVN
jgi:hypothetical protein